MFQHVVVVVVFGAAFFSAPSEASLETLCQGIRFGTFPHPSDCRQYVVCFQGRPQGNPQCPAGFVFNPEVLFCVHESQYQCELVTTPDPEVVTTTEASWSSTSVTTEGPPECVYRPSWESFFCEDARRDLVANPMNCSQYIDCQADPPRNNLCPSGTVFNDPYQDCLPGEDQGCELATLDERFCENRTDGTYAHPFLCNRFISCVRQQTRFESCPPFYVYDPERCYCVKGSAVACSSLLEQR